MSTLLLSSINLLLQAVQPGINGTFWATTIFSLVIFIIAFCFQWKYFQETKKYRNLFNNFFQRKESYATYKKVFGIDELTQIKQVAEDGSDLNKLIVEINNYVAKTKGTTDFSVIQNKVERMLNMRYDQSTARLSFPTYIGLMGTFGGVFFGILMFLWGFDGAGNISDDSIKNLLSGVLVSMSTSLCGLLLTTISNGMAGGARKKIEEDKNDFYDFVQTELMPSLDVSMVAAITKLHETVDKFEPAFNTVIQRFQTTFYHCTRAFGDNFETHVNAVAGAVEVMGKNMDKINKNIQLQEKLLATLKSGEFVTGIEKYIEAAQHFVSITQSLNKFEEARRMMLAAAKEAIDLQNQYNESLKIPREVAIRVNQILDRIKDFENSVNEAGRALTQRDILGNEVVTVIKDQIKGISRKGHIADKYLQMADGKLEDLYSQQTKVLTEMNRRYKEAIEGHIEGFESMLTKQTEELEKRHKEFMQAIEERFNVEDVRQEFTNLQKLSKLEEIQKKLQEIANGTIKQENIHSEVASLQKAIEGLKKELEEISKNTKNTKNTNEGGGIGSWFGRR